MNGAKLISIASLFFAIGLETLAQSYGGGSGTREAPYLITSKGDLVALAMSVNSGHAYVGEYFLLTVDLSDVATTIGNSKEHFFGGVFDGGGHSIAVSIDVEGSLDRSETYAGIFGCLSGATVKQLSVTGSIVSSSILPATPSNSSYVGGLCGYLKQSTILDCHFSGEVTSISAFKSSNVVDGGTACAGGICGYSEESTIRYCCNTGAIAAYNTTSSSDYSNIAPSAGGICGMIKWATTISDCCNVGPVSAHSTYSSKMASAGGVCGFAWGASVISQCYNTGAIASSVVPTYSIYMPPHAGGICGRDMGNGLITACFAANANITGKVGEANGGVIGRIYGKGDYSNSTVDLCYAASSLQLNGATTTSQSVSSFQGRDATLDSFQSPAWFADNLLWDLSDTWYMSSVPGAFPLLRKNQRINFQLDFSDMTYGDQTQLGLAGTSDNSVMPLVFKSSNSEVAEVVGTTLYIRKTGTVTISASQASHGVYKSALISHVLTIKPRLLTIRANDLSRVYGDSLPHFTANYDGFVLGESEADLTQRPSFSCSANMASSVGTYVVTPWAAQSPNYSFLYKTGQLTVTKAPLKVYLQDTSFCYGESYPPMMWLQYEGLKNNEKQPALKSGNKLYLNWKAGQKPGTYSSTFEPGEPLNYAYLPYKGNTFTITKAPLLVTVNTTTKTYGDDNPPFSLVYLGFKYTDTVDSLLEKPTVHTLATKSSPVGSYPVTVAGGLSDCYNLVYKVDTLRVNPATLTVVAQDTSKVYGMQNPTFAVSMVGLRNNDTEAVIPNLTVKSPASETSGVGTYAIVPQGPFYTDNYSLFYQHAKLTIQPAPLTVQVKDTSRFYGEANPLFTCLYTGFQNGDTTDVLKMLPTFATNADWLSLPGDSLVTVSGGQADNYRIDAYIPGIVTIKKAPLTIWPGNATRAYGDINPKFTVSCRGLRNNETPWTLDTLTVFEIMADSLSKPGDYPIRAYGAASKKYDITYDSAVLTITKRKLTTKVPNYSKAYLSPNPTFEIAYEGFVNHEGPSVLERKPFIHCEATNTSGVGSYPLTLSGGLSDCYDFDYIHGVLTISRLNQSITWTQTVDSFVQGQQVLLSAVSTAELPVSYSLEPNPVARMYEANGQTYLDCFGHGQVLLKASQDGNSNVFAAPNVTKVINVVPIQTEKTVTLTIQSGEGGVTKQVVDSGSLVRIGIEPSLGWVVHTVSFNGADVTDSLVDSVFTTPPMTSDGLLSITFEMINQLLEMVVSPVKVYTRSSEIVVHGLTPGETVELYGINGTIERKVLAEGNEQSFSVRPGAAYLVRAGGKTVKVVL